MDIRQALLLHGRDITSNSIALKEERDERLTNDSSTRIMVEDRMKNVVNLFDVLIKQNTELITLIRVQQQVGK